MARRTIQQGPIEPPAHLDQQARRKWAEVYPLLEAHGNVDQGTLDGLTGYCVAWSEWLAARAKVAELGTVIKSAAGFAVVSPYVGVAAQAERRLRQWAGELRLTPKARKNAAEGGESAILGLMQAAEVDVDNQGAESR